MNTIIEEIRQELVRHSEEAHRLSAMGFFREEVSLYGVKSAEVTGIAKRIFKNLTNKSKDIIFSHCEELWKSGMLEESFIACNWSYNVRTEFEPSDIEIFGYWIDRYVSNWASCDTLCNHTVGALVEMYPQSIRILKKWTGSANRWMRRASAVSLIIPARKGLHLEEIFEIADILLLDKDDMVQKGYGWMLKSASHLHKMEVFDYVYRNKGIMPRISLRYAIEKMPRELRIKAME